MPRTKYVVAAAAALVLLALPGASVYYQYSGGKACTRCHEIQKPFDQWHVSTHRNVACTSCHGSALSFDVKFHLANFRRVVQHFRGADGDRIHIKHTDLAPIVERCQKCHRQEFADWQAGPHGVSYAKIFLDKKENSKRLLMDDCLRCHGMHFEGGIRDLVTPVSTHGPWALKSPEMGDRPAIPCLACHQMHREGKPLVRGTPRVAPLAATQEGVRPSVALYDRREQMHISTNFLTVPAMRDGDRPVRRSPDQRQALCYQCHAPVATIQAGSGDDRTPVGVHEGLSCLACHQKHGQQTRASCANCHPRLSNCGLDVEKMDTTFKGLKSAHNIHFVKCVDCHEKGVPTKRKDGSAVVLRSAIR
ncbi:MAG TPA: cytochrome c3 family protein [Bryobacteraceae bacterium]